MSDFLKQQFIYGCGLFAIANALNSVSLITDERIEQSENGNNFGQLNKWLIESGFEYFIDPLYFDFDSFDLPEHIQQLRPHDEQGRIDFMPLLIEVRKTKDSLNHLIAVELYPNGKCLVKDSVEKSIYYSDLKTISDQNYVCNGVYCFSSIENSERVYKLK